jgi:hypothetical protein
MPTAYTIAFEANGNVQTITSVCNGRDRLDVKHPVRQDTFRFTIASGGTTTYNSVRVFFRGSTDTDDSGLFRYRKTPTSDPSAYVPFDTVLTVAYDGAGTTGPKTFHFTPSTTAFGTTTENDSRPHPTAPPDTGSIKVGG